MKKRIRAVAFSDCGNYRKTNQDAVLVKVMNSNVYGRMMLIGVADGMGGLSQGEVASSIFIRDLESWFNEQLPIILQSENSIIRIVDSVQESLKSLYKKVNTKIRIFGKKKGIKLGTTASVLFTLAGRFLTVNVGDSRIYQVCRSKCIQITKDQSYVQRLIDGGAAGNKEVRNSRNNNILLQCLGVTEEVSPDINKGKSKNVGKDYEYTYMACTDGFWKELEDREIHRYLCPQMCISEVAMESLLGRLKDMARQRGEMDNMTAALIYEVE